VDQEVLVDEAIEEGHDLIMKLIGEGCDVKVAFWARKRDGRLWSLYIATKPVAKASREDLWGVVLDAMEQVRPRTFDLTSLSLIQPKSPSATAAMKASQTRHPHRATRLLECTLGDLPIDEAYIYPKPTGTMGRGTVAHQVADLMTGTGDSEPSLVILRDGTRINAVPVGMQRTTAGGVDVVWHDVDADVDRSISADEVADIQLGRLAPPFTTLIPR
jgi:hypothetical protein